MGSSKSKPAKSSFPALHGMRILWRAHNRGLALTALVVAVSIGGLVYGWRRWGEPAMHAGQYVVTAENIHITPPPTWIHSDIKTQVIRTAGIAQLPLGDTKLVEQIAHAFALHPWVAKVVRVQKRFPARVDVELVYRRPVAAVEVSDRGEPALLFIDEHSVILPSGDFAPQQAKDFLRIAGSKEPRTGGVGMPWGSERIAGAARLAAAWGQRWRPLGLYRIEASLLPGGQTQYELTTHGQARIVWGAAPGHESAGEPSAEQKIAALEQFVRHKGPLENGGGSPPPDLRQLAAAPATTARGGKSAPPR
jgi:hypothetical protein